MDDQKIQLTFDADTVALAQVQARLLATKAETESLEAAQAKLYAEMERVAKAAREIGEDPANLKPFQMAARQFKENGDRLNDLYKETGNAKRGMAGFGQSMLQTGRVVQDFSQGGIGGILNNIEGLTMSLGMGTGLAGALTIIGVGFMLLRPKIQQLFDSFDSTKLHEVKDDIKAIEDRIKELSGKTVKFKVEHEELNKLQKELDRVKKAINEYNALMGKQTEFEAKSGRQVEEAIVELPGGQKAVDSAKDAFVEQALSKPENQKKLAYFDEHEADLKKQIEGAEKTRDIKISLGQDATGQEQVIRGLKKAIEDNRAAKDDAENTITANAGRKFEGMVLEAKSGKGQSQLANQEMLAKWLDHAGGKEGQAVAGAIRGSSPKAIEENEKDNEENFDPMVKRATESGKQAHQAVARRRKRAQAESDQELENFTAGEQGRIDRFHERQNTANQAAGSLAKMYGSGVLGEDVLKAMKSGMDEAKIAEEIRKVISREGVDPKLQGRVAKAMIGNARQDMAEERAKNPYGDPGIRMPSMRPKRYVGKRNRAIAERNARRAAKAAVNPRALPKVAPYRGPMPVPSVKIPELKIGGDNDKSVSLLGDIAGGIKRLVESNDDMARQGGLRLS